MIRIWKCSWSICIKNPLNSKHFKMEENVKYQNCILRTKMWMWWVELSWLGQEMLKGREVRGYKARVTGNKRQKSEDEEATISTSRIWQKFNDRTEPFLSARIHEAEWKWSETKRNEVKKNVNLSHKFSFSATIFLTLFFRSPLLGPNWRQHF